MTILDTILETKRNEVATKKQARSLADLLHLASARTSIRDFAAALTRNPGSSVRVLAEIKRASPSAGAIFAGADPAHVAGEYEANGAAAISVLTDETYFDGHDSFLQLVRDAVELPLLRKDFIVDEYQVVEAKALEADAVLLIAAALGKTQLRDLHQAAQGLGLAALVEIHALHELEAAQAAGAEIVGVNHRDLRTFTLDMSLTAGVAPLLDPSVVLVAESGIRTHDDVVLLGAVGAHAVLVGEALMKSKHPGESLRKLRGQAQ